MTTESVTWFDMAIRRRLLRAGYTSQTLSRRMGHDERWYGKTIARWKKRGDIFVRTASDIETAVADLEYERRRENERRRGGVD